MSLDILLPVISNVVGRDLRVELNLFYRARKAIGTSLNEAGQKYFIENWPRLVDFMETPKGQEALTFFFEEWADSELPKNFTNPQPEIKETAMIGVGEAAQA